MLLGLGAAEHRLALGHVDQEVRRGAAAVVAVEEVPHLGALQRALLGQLADRRLGGRLPRFDAAARQHGVLTTVEATLDHEHLRAAHHHGHGTRHRAPERCAGHYFLPAFSPLGALDNAAMKASCGTSTRPTIFIRFLPSFCFSSSLRLRVMSPP